MGLKNDISILRHEGKYNKYIEHMLKKNDIFNVIPYDFEYNSYNNYITNEILNKNIFSFSLNIENKNIGFLSLVDFDWENRNCRIICSVFDKYLDDIEIKHVKLSIEKILEFCKNDLRIKRVWGITYNGNPYSSMILDDLFSFEGTSKNKDILYYGYVFE